MSRPLISGGPLFSLRCSARGSSLPPLVNDGNLPVSESVSKADPLSDYHLCLQVERGQAYLVRLGPTWWH